MTSLKGFRGSKITNNFFKEKNHIIQTKKKPQKVFSQPWTPLPEREPTTPKQQPLQQSPGQSLQIKEKFTKKCN